MANLHIWLKTKNYIPVIKFGDIFLAFSNSATQKLYNFQNEVVFLHLWKILKLI